MRIKKFVILLCVLFIFGADAYAEVTANLSESDNTITVEYTGTDRNLVILIPKSGKTAADVNADVLSGNESDICYYRHTLVRDGEKRFTIPFDGNERGIYNIYVNGEHTVVGYASVEYRNEIEDRLHTATPGEFKRLLDENLMCMGIDIELYNALSQKGFVGEYVSNKLNPATADIAEVIREANRAIVMQALNEKLNVSQKKLLANASFDDDTEKDMLECLTDDGIHVVLKAVSGNSYSDFGKFRADVRKNCALYHISHPVQTDAYTIAQGLEKENVYLGLNLTKFIGLSAQNKSTVARKLYVDKPGSIAQLQSLIDKYCDEYYKRPVNEGGGGSGAKPSYSVPKVEIQLQENKDNITASDSVKRFSDLQGYAWAEECVNSLAERNIISGYGDGSFRPGGSITRAEVTVMIAKCLYNDFNMETTFADVPSGHWARGYIAAAEANGIISGFNGLFRPDDYIKREDIAVILYKALNADKQQEDTVSDVFEDDENISDYARQAVYALKKLGIISGNEKGCFNPSNFASRAETAKMIYGFLAMQ